MDITHAALPYMAGGGANVHRGCLGILHRVHSDTFYVNVGSTDNDTDR